MVLCNPFVSLRDFSPNGSTFNWWPGSRQRSTPLFYDSANNVHSDRDKFQAAITAGSEELFVVIHGYDVAPETALENAMNIQRQLDVLEPGRFLVIPFVWATRCGRGKWIDYYMDKFTSVLAGHTFAQACEALRKTGRKCHLFAHSMGARVAKNMLIKHRRNMWETITLMAADIPAGSLKRRHLGHKFARASKRVIVVFNPGDVALKWSGRLMINQWRKRIGAVIAGELPKNATPIDASEYAAHYDRREHTYSLAKDEAVNPVMRMVHQHL